MPHLTITPKTKCGVLIWEENGELHAKFFTDLDEGAKAMSEKAGELPFYYTTAQNVIEAYWERMEEFENKIK